MKKPLIVLVVAASLPAAIAAQSVPLTLGAAIERGVEFSRRLAEQNARIAGAQAAVVVREAAKRPTVMASAGYTRTNHVDEFGILTPAGALRLIYPDIPDNYHTRLDVQWPLYTGGRVESLTRSAQLEVQAIQDERDATRSDVRLDVARAYWSLVAARETVRVVEESWKRVNAHYQDASARFNAGLLMNVDLLAVDQQRSRHAVRAVEARTAALVAEADLRRLLGLEPGAAIALEATLGPPAWVSEDLDGLKDEARRSRPELKALAVRVEAARARETAASAQRRPSLAVHGGVDYASPNPRIFPRADEWRTSWDVSVNVGWTLWNGGRTKAEAAEADASARALRARLEDVDAALAFEVEQRVLELESARATIAAAEAAVGAAAEIRRVVAERFAQGVASNTQALDAQFALLDAELERTRALAAAQLARARLDRALGR